jgi:hypothetical protein
MAISLAALLTHVVDGGAELVAYAHVRRLHQPHQRTPSLCPPTKATTLNHNTISYLSVKRSDRANDGQR